MNEKKRTGQDRTRKKSEKGTISPTCGEAPTEAMYMKICVVGDVLDVGLITCAKFQNEISRRYNFAGVEFSIYSKRDTYVHVRYMLSPVRLSSVCLSFLYRFKANKDEYINTNSKTYDDSIICHLLVRASSMTVCCSPCYKSVIYCFSSLTSRILSWAMLHCFPDFIVIGFRPELLRRPYIS